MRTFGRGAREPGGHLPKLSYFLFTAPEGGKTRLGGELRREEQLLPRAGMSTDRDGTDDDLSKGVFHLPSPPWLRHDRSRTGAEVSQVRLDQLKLTSLADQRPRSGCNMPRIVAETSDTFLFQTVS
jgi:hypothetical protein